MNNCRTTMGLRQLLDHCEIVTVAGQLWDSGRTDLYAGHILTKYEGYSDILGCRT